MWFSFTEKNTSAPGTFLWDAVVRDSEIFEMVTHTYFLKIIILNKTIKII